jgi:hypothetical protein
VLHRGYAIVDGEHARVWFIQNEAFVTQVRVEGSDREFTMEARYWQSVGEAERVAL